MKIDFTKKRLLTESWMKAFGSWNKTFLKYLYGKDVTMTADLTSHKMMNEEDEDNSLKFVIRGEYKDVQAYAKAIMAEKEYLDYYIKFGEDHFQTKKQKELLDQAVNFFQRTTGIRWPFKD
jgi:alpha/beta superfamily hydrolase